MKVPLPVLRRLPRSRVVVELTPTGGPLARGAGPHRWVCGECGRVVGDGVDREIFGGVVVRCRCGAFNETAKLPPSGED
jgi:hypothetical protein